MRLQRIVTALIAVALIGLTNDKVLKNGKGWLIFKGNVDPGWNHKNVKVYKRSTKGGAFKFFKKVKTDGSGAWSVRIYAPRSGYWYWKGVVPQSDGYAKSTTNIWKTYTI
jgi:hypothetical protein